MLDEHSDISTFYIKFYLYLSNSFAVEINILSLPSCHTQIQNNISPHSILQALYNFFQTLSKSIQTIANIMLFSSSFSINLSQETIPVSSIFLFQFSIWLYPQNKSIESGTMSCLQNL